MKTNDKKAFIPAAQLVRACKKLSFDARYMTQDDDGHVYLWADGYDPYASMLSRSWQIKEPCLKMFCVALGYFNVLEFHGRRWDNRILDLREVKNDWLLPQPKVRNVKNKNNYEWTKGK